MTCRVKMKVEEDPQVTLTVDEKIEQGGITPTGTIVITENGQHDVTDYAEAAVEVPGIIPTGTLEITQNGEHDVTTYAKAEVNVSGGSDSIIIGNFSDSVELADSGISLQLPYELTMFSAKKIIIDKCTRLYIFGSESKYGILSEYENTKVESITINRFVTKDVTSKADPLYVQNIMIYAKAVLHTPNIIIKDDSLVPVISYDVSSDDIRYWIPEGVYVPDSRYNDYLADSKWSRLALWLHPLSEYVEE